MGRRFYFTVLGLAALIGCAHGPAGTLGPDYFKHNESGYELIYLGAGPERGLGVGWTLDNYTKQPARGGRTAYFVREGDAYGFDRRYDFDNDGLPDYRARRATYDLRYTQDGGEGAIWLRSVVLAQSLKDKSLADLALRYASKVPRVGVPFVHFGEGLPAGVADARYQVDTLSQQADCEVANVPAHRIDLEVRDGAEVQRVTAVLMRPGYSHSLLANGKTYTYEVVLLAVHVNAPGAFEASAPTFDAMLDRLSLARGQRPHTCRPEAAPAEGESPEAPATSGEERPAIEAAATPEEPGSR